jgi:hypothetical protein
MGTGRPVSAELRQKSYPDGTAETSTDLVTLRYTSDGHWPVELMFRSGNTLPITREEWADLKVLAAKDTL